MKQPFTDEETARLMKDWTALRNESNQRTKTWRARKAELLPKMRAQTEWESWYFRTHSEPWDKTERPGKLA